MLFGPSVANQIITAQANAMSGMIRTMMGGISASTNPCHVQIIWPGQNDGWYVLMCNLDSGHKGPHRDGHWCAFHDEDIAFFKRMYDLERECNSDSLE